MSLYHHVRDKTDLLGAMLEQVAAEVDLSRRPCVAPGGAGAVRGHARRADAAPWSASLWVSLGLPGPARTRLLETLLRRLREGGFGPELLDVAFHTINNHTVGHALQAIGFDLDRDQLVAGANAFLDHLDQDTHPELTAHVLWHLDQPPGPSGDASGSRSTSCSRGWSGCGPRGDLWRPRSLTSHTDGAAGSSRSISRNLSRSWCVRRAEGFLARAGCPSRRVRSPRWRRGRYRRP